MTQIFLDHLSYVLGDEKISVEEAAERDLIISDPSVLRETGFHYQYICRPETTSYDLAKRSVEEIKNHLGDIGAIIYHTAIPKNGNIGDEAKFNQTRDVKYLTTSPASRIQADFSLGRAIVVGLSQQACTGMLGSLRLAKMMLVAEPELNRILCVTTDRFPNGALYENLYNLISDGAAACVVSTQPQGFQILACHGITNGAMELLPEEEAVASYFSYTYKVITETLAKANLQISDIDWIVPQNTSAKAWQILAKFLKFSFDYVYFPTLSELGHMTSGDNIINLKKLAESGNLKSGQKIVLFLGGGFNWQCVILQKC